MEEESESPVCGLFISDVHWWDVAPVSRSNEPDWMMTQENYWRQLRSLQIECGMAPIFIAGDLLVHWDARARLISAVIRWLKGMNVHAIPGNHDLPRHNYQLMPQSAYWTLVEAGAINHLTPGGTHSFNELIVYPFPSGFKPVTPNRGKNLCLHVALIHEYVWTQQTGYEGAPETARYGAWAKQLKGFDVAVFGDNHIPFCVVKEGWPTVYNCGTFMRRHSDEKGIKPGVGLLRTDGTITRQVLNVTGERWLNVQEEVARHEKALELELSGFANELVHRSNEQMDYARTVIKWAKKEKVPDRVVEIILSCLKGRKGRADSV